MILIFKMNNVIVSQMVIKVVAVVWITYATFRVHLFI